MNTRQTRTPSAPPNPDPRPRRGLALLEPALTMVVLVFVIGGIMLLYQSAAERRCANEVRENPGKPLTALCAKLAGKAR